MSRSFIRLLSAISLCIAALGASAAGKPGVVIYATGGTIAGASKSNTDTTNYKAGSLGIDVLINAVPELNDVATVSGEQISNVSSSNVSSAILLKLSKAINEKLASPDIHGAVVTHGTDTLEESALFLDLTVKSSKPLVIVGAMRPATAISADGPMNLLEAVALAASKDAENRGAMVLLNDRFASAYYVTKTNSTVVDTFRAVEQGYLGMFTGTVPHFYYEPAMPVGKPFFDVSKTESLPRVDVIYMHEDQDLALIDAAIAVGAKGIVIAGSGNGAMPAAVKTKVAELSKKGFPVVVSTRTGSGFVSKKEAGIGSGFMNPQKARILLMLAINAGASDEKIRAYFGTF